MEYTSEEIMNRMNAYVSYAQQIKEIKDLLLDFEIYGDEDTVSAAVQQQDELIKEIHIIYQERMLPIVQDLARYVSENIQMLTEPPPQGEAALEAEDHAESLEAGACDDDDRPAQGALDMKDAFFSTIVRESAKKQG